MNTLAFDARMGASGDMLCATLLAVGADPSVLDPVEDALDVRYVVGSTTKAGIASTTVDVVLDEDSGAETGDHDRDHAEREQGHSHDHDDHDHDHTHDHASDEHHDHAEGGGPNRTYAEVVDIVREMDLPSVAERTALAVFRRLGEAEATVHGTDLESTHFHEVGADDAIADVVGATLLLADLGVERVVTTPVSTGGGTVSMSHGDYPVPTPAVTELVADADWSIRGGPVDRELLTPTGAAILAEIATGVETLPTLDIDATGYGAGDADVAHQPNVLRAIAGTGCGGLRREPITVLETTLDDATPEVLGGLQETLADAGAHDVSIVPTTMKKSRPGHVVTVIVDPADAERVARRLAAETGTLGVREGGASHRWVADRSFETVTLDVAGERHDVTVKVATDADGEVYDVSAEYDDAAAVASETDLPVREVLRRAETAFED
ncbi:nickel pincer cofactor biosynthesis protein LarC [Haloplanus halobius]|uniref:nickel pincer cofactor biosynthesis protein LarC n=1 Tax=Haloplanus halobius TaxID=2934938 RepID=UPI00200CB4BF|nr:nickel pincer cofactor biosynthesis protein LarC [Haloplanus sp. XH21]